MFKIKIGDRVFYATSIEKIIFFVLEFFRDYLSNALHYSKSSQLRGPRWLELCQCKCKYLNVIDNYLLYPYVTGVINKLLMPLWLHRLLGYSLLFEIKGKYHASNIDYYIASSIMCQYDHHEKKSFKMLQKALVEFSKLISLDASASIEKSLINLALRYFDSPTKTRFINFNMIKSMLECTSSSNTSWARSSFLKERLSAILL